MAAYFAEEFKFPCKAPAHITLIEPMDKRTLYIWLLLAASIIIAGIIISVFVKAIKVVLMVILVLALAPVIFFVLKRLLLPGNKSRKDKLKKRD